ncbi:MAG TPA: UDP-2,4-diacetamido-2,4,6-trideoxy-beta-L-altropyranose hydrolase [Candidatus Sulfotelmatobacter sp.]|nr:UDP-2,4-diacetamido-2,4,6-trideoxy-beta-L-altropyranose hydrolase [Candidatus Sulfotelmatobacter sp.]
MSTATLLIRADAGVLAGTGHVMRCLALAQAWQDAGGRAVFAMAESTPAIQARLAAESCEILTISSPAGTSEDATQTIAIARKRQATWIVVDGYQFNADYQRALKEAAFMILFVDDYGHAGHYSADLVLNQNVCADQRLYGNREPYTRLLLGTRYCMLRREFRAWRDWKREIPSVATRLLATVGGSDPDNVTLCVVQALGETELSPLEGVVVVGGSNPHLTSIQQAASDSRHKVRVVTNPANMAELMAWADVAVSGAGSTCWEICALGLPALLLCVAQNQKASAECLAEKGAALLLDTRSRATSAAISASVKELALEASLRERICRTAHELVDCDGAVRVVSRIQHWGGVHDVVARRDVG